MSSAISCEMQAAVGREVRRRVSYPVAASDIRRWAIAVSWPEPPPQRYLLTDESRLVAPEDLNPFAWATVRTSPPPQPPAPGAPDGGYDPDAVENQLGIAGPGLTHQLNGGLSVEYGTAMRPGDVITSVETLTSYHERDGRLGRMLFTTTTDLWTNQLGAQVKRTEMTVIRY